MNFKDSREPRFKNMNSKINVVYAVTTTLSYNEIQHSIYQDRVTCWASTEVTVACRPHPHNCHTSDSFWPWPSFDLLLSQSVDYNTLRLTRHTDHLLASFRNFLKGIIRKNRWTSCLFTKVTGWTWKLYCSTRIFREHQICKILAIWAESQNTRDFLELPTTIVYLHRM